MLLCSLAGLWIRSTVVSDTISFAYAGFGPWINFDGGHATVTITIFYAYRGYTRISHDRIWTVRWADASHWWGYERKFRLWGLLFFRSDRSPSKDVRGREYRNGFWYIGMVLPLWVPMAIVSIPLFRFFWRLPRRRRWLRSKKGLCVQCGYDLRASHGRCPECGRPISRTESALRGCLSDAG